jgi:phosphohistidine swiveling domain-containing protein
MIDTSTKIRAKVDDGKIILSNQTSLDGDLSLSNSEDESDYIVEKSGLTSAADLKAFN